ncbi:hypothetical protein HGRIS_008887 [Hohenbuehelia grisea]|uniref:CBM1 domain-containing protein n=1 Tax=Hohenbuehelia grisea TaxID=104357 RepID=A0ABR3IZL8_9AGAR
MGHLMIPSRLVAFVTMIRTNLIVACLFLALGGSVVNALSPYKPLTTTTTTRPPPPSTTTKASSTSDAGTTTCYTPDWPTVPVTQSPTITNSGTLNPTGQCWTTYITLSASPTPTPSPPAGTVRFWGTCGGIGNGFPGGVVCQSGSVCIHHNDYDATCIPGPYLPIPATSVPSPVPSGLTYIPAVRVHFISAHWRFQILIP